MAKTKKVSKPKEAGDYLITLRIGDEVYSAEAFSVSDALASLPPEIKYKIKVKTIMRVESGNESAEVSLYPFQLKRILVNSVARQLLQKKVDILLKK